MASSGNFGTWNPLNIGSGGSTSLTVGNTNAVMTGADPRTAANVGGVISDTDGYYFETVATSAGSGALTLGIINEDRHNQLTSGQIHSRSGSFMWRGYDGGAFFVETSSNTSYGTFTDGDIIGWFIKNSKLYVKKNNSDVVGDVVNTSAGIDISGGFFFPAVSRTVGGGAQTSSILRTDSDDWSYSPPEGFKGLTSKDMLISSDIDPAGDDGADENPTKQFNIVTYTGDASTSNAVSNLGFQPDLVWIKAIDDNNLYSNALFDSSRGRAKSIFSDNSRDEDSSSSTQDLVSFDSDGFTVGTSYNTGSNLSGKAHVAWCWRANGGTTASNSEGSTTCTVQANTKGGFSIITYTGTGSAATLGHGLEKAPEFIMAKRRSSAAQSWKNYHVGIGPTKYLTLNAADAEGTSSGMWNDTAPTDTLIHIGNESNVSTSSKDYVIYAWHGVEGYSKFGSYTGNGNSNGTFVYTGFRPRLIFTKRFDGGSENWGVFDTARANYNPTSAHSDGQLVWDTANAATAGSTHGVDFLSNGFKLRGTGGLNNQSGGTYIYGAWSDVPFKYNNTF